MKPSTKKVIFWLMLCATYGAPVFAAPAAQLPESYKKITDLGVAPDETVKTVNLALKIVDRAKLESFIASTSDPSSANYRRFLTPQQFKAVYGQSDLNIATIRAYLVSRGITVTKVYPNNLMLSVKMMNAQFKDTFGASVHRYQIEGEAVFEKPSQPAVIPTELSAVIGAVSGANSRPLFESRLKKTPTSSAPFANNSRGTHALKALPYAENGTNIPGEYNVKDVARMYNINPLYERGITGKGVTLGIITFADFDPGDAYAYWTSLGLRVARDRVSFVSVDGASGSVYGEDEETTLDVEQAGGIAPDAKIIVYQGQNTTAGALDLYATAVNDNVADSLSTSWGAAESEQDSTTFAAYDAIFMQAAAQGIPFSASSGDAGAYDINSGFNYPYCTALLTVDFPASNPYLVAVGGTTTPFSGAFENGVSVNIAKEQPWAWDYLMPYYASISNQYGYWYRNDVFPVGGGGGVSTTYDMPKYQSGVSGTKKSENGQFLICGLYYSTYKLPGNFAGRNVPDVSLNADPYSGFLLYYQGVAYSGLGGTSFTAPQMNGVFALITQQLQHRVGFATPQLYEAFKSKGYGTGSPFKPVTTGENLFYTAKAGYNPATGIGTLNVNNLANYLSSK